MGGVTEWVGRNVFGIKPSGKGGAWYQANHPKDPETPPTSPDATDEAVQNARLFERRQQIGLMGRMSTFLTTGAGQSKAATPASINPPTTFLGQ